MDLPSSSDSFISFDAGGGADTWLAGAANVDVVADVALVPSCVSKSLSLSTRPFSWWSDSFLEADPPRFFPNEDPYRAREGDLDRALVLTERDWDRADLVRERDRRLR